MIELNRRRLPTELALRIAIQKHLWQSARLPYDAIIQSQGLNSERRASHGQWGECWASESSRTWWTYPAGPVSLLCFADSNKYKNCNINFRWPSFRRHSPMISRAFLDMCGCLALSTSGFDSEDIRRRTTSNAEEHTVEQCRT